MVNKKILIFVFLFTTFLFLAAQNSDTGEKAASSEHKNYFIKENESGDVVLYQRLSWEAVEDIKGFEFRLEKREFKSPWKLIDKKVVNDNFIDVSLPPGKYRYRVAVINLLNQIETISDYRNFDVRIALRPEVSSVSPKIIYFDELKDNFIIINGKNFHEDTVFVLKKTLGGSFKGEILDIEKNGKQIKVGFDLSKFNPGEYVLTVTDPSGLKSNTGRVNFKFQKPIDIFLCVGYAFTGFAGNKVFKEYFNRDFAALGGLMRFTLLPIKRYYGNFGVNLTFSGMSLNSKKEFYRMDTGFFLTQINAAYIYPIIKKRLNFDVHMGMGIAFLTNFVKYTTVDIESSKYWYGGITLNAGTAFQIYMYKKLYIECNLDHVFTFRKGFPNNNGFPIYIIQPSLSIGWEF